MGFVDSIETRGLKFENVFICSFFAGLNEFGILSQAVVNQAGRRVGKYLATYCKEKGSLEPIPDKSEIEQCHNALSVLNADLMITLEPADVCVEKANDHILIKIKNQQCRFCPKGVGEAELAGTLCPFPGLLETFLSPLVGRELKLKKVNNNKPLVKDGDWCKICVA